MADAELPPFEDIRAQAHAVLGDVFDLLLSDCTPDEQPTAEQAGAVRRARLRISEARAELNAAAAAPADELEPGHDLLNRIWEHADA